MKTKRYHTKRQRLSKSWLESSLRKLDPDFRASTDHSTLQRNVMLAGRLFRTMKRVVPNSSDRLVSGIAVDLADIWMVGEVHRKQLKEICSLRLPQEQERLQSLLARLEVNLLYESRYHLTSLKKLLPRYVKSLRARKKNKVTAVATKPRRI